MTRIHLVMTLSEWLLLITLSVLWGGSFFFSKVALTEIPPLTLVLARVGLAAIMLNLLALTKGELSTNSKLWRQFWVMGILNNLIPFSLIFWSQTEISSSLASILNATAPLWTVVLAHCLTQDERISGSKFIGLLLGLLGVVVLMGPSVWGAFNFSQDLNLFAQLAVLAAALSYAFAGIFGRRFRSLGVSPLSVAAGQLTCTTIMILPVASLIERPWMLAIPDLTILGAVLGLAILSTALAYMIYFKLLAAVGATNLMLVTFLIPITALILGLVFLGEALANHQIVGMVLVGLGLAAIDGRFNLLSVNARS